MAWRPLLIFVANFLAGWLITRGFIDPADHNEIAQVIADTLGYFILGVTSVASLYHALKHPNGVKPQQPVVQQTTTITESKQEQVVTEGFSQDPGTPPLTPLPPAVQ